MATWLQQFGDWNTNMNAGIFGGKNTAGVMQQASGFGKAMGSLGIDAGNIGGIANTIGQLGTGLLAGQNQSDVGNALQTVGSLASNIPGVGGLIGAGVGVVGGLVNAAFGSNINDEFVSQTKSQANALGSRVFNANTNADLLNDWQSMVTQSNVSKSEVGSDGWFSNKASRETRRLNERIKEANRRQLANFDIAAQNVDDMNDLRILQNMAAYGGPINSFRKYYADGGPTNPPVDPLVAPLDVDLNLNPIGYEMPQEEEPVMKVSAKLADEVIATPKAFTPTDAKNDIRNFYVNDFAQRRQKYHPTETPTQIGNLFDNAHVEFGDIGTGIGGTYNSGNITVSKRLSDNAKRSTTAHEMRHLMDDQLGGLTPEESQILHDAYNLKADKGYQHLEDEYPTTNTELRYKISRDYNNATGEELNKIIQGLSDDNLINRAIWVNGYNQIPDKILSPKNDKQRLEQKKKADAIRKALMEVAFNPAQIPFNYAAEGGLLNTPQFFTFEPQTYDKGGYLNQAKALIRQNEGWSAKPYSDSPKGKNWRSVGYGFNDSGFRDKYPEGISKHYEHGITKKQAEEELDYFLNKAEKRLKSIYGKQWNDFSDSQKAAILDTYYQRPASVDKSSRFYKAVTAGEDAGKYLGVAGFNKRNSIRQNVFSGGKSTGQEYSMNDDSENTLTHPSPILEATSPIVDYSEAFAGVTPTQAKALELNFAAPNMDFLASLGQPTRQAQAAPTVGTVEDFLSSYGDFEGNLFKDGGNLYGDGGGIFSIMPMMPLALDNLRKAKDKAVDYVRQKLYERVDPVSYDIPGAISSLFINGRETGKNDIYNALWAKYLNRTNIQAGQNVDEYLQPAVYSLTKGTPIGKLYRLTPKAWDNNDDMNPLGDEALYHLLKSGKKSYVTSGNTKTGLGDYTVSLGEDENGKYMSYYDEWDISPIGNKRGKAGKDQSMGIGTPFSVYDRRYYTDEEMQHIISEYDKMYKSIEEATKNQSVPHKIYSPKPYKAKKHSDGGNLLEDGDKLNIKDMNIFDFGGGITHGVNWDTGVDYVAEGQSHEQNPYGGVMVGKDEEGTPNLVEEGEYIWNGDYVFSRRMKVPKKLREKYKLPEDATFADAVKVLTKESEERPNDEISRATQDHILGELADSQEELRAAKAQRAMDKQMQLQDDFLMGVQFGLGGGLFADGGGIHIDPSKKGTFKAQASKMGMGVQEAASHILANKENYSPAMVKKAVFAHNFAHDLGGSLFANGGNLFSKPSFYNEFKRGGDLELMDDTTPVDRRSAEDELVYDPRTRKYILITSNRETRNKKQAAASGTQGTKKGSEKKGSARTKQTKGATGVNLYGYYTNGNDGISIPTGFKVDKNGKAFDYTPEYRELVSKLGANDIRAWAAAHPNDPSLKSFLAKGNKLENLTDEQWRTGATDGKYGFMHHVADQIGKETATVPANYNWEQEAPWLFGNVAAPTPQEKLSPMEQIARDKSTPTRSVSVTNNGTNFGMLDTTPVTTRGGITDNGTDGEGLTRSPFKPKQTWTRYAPLAMNALFGLKEMLTPADYTNANAIMDAAYQVGTPVSVGTEYIGDYRKRDPFDESYLMNIINQNSRAANRNFMNTSGGNRAVAMSGILANDLITQRSLAEAARQAYLANRADDAQVAEFNRGTNIFNAQAQNQRNQYLAGLNSQRQNAMLSGISQGARLKQAIKDQRDAAISANLSAFAQGLGDLGRENGFYNMLGGLNDEGILNYFYGDDWNTKFNR